VTGRAGRPGPWLLALGSAVLALYLLKGILLPFVAGLAIAYFLDPAADRLERRGLSRALATSVITAAFFVLLAAAATLLAPMLQAQLADFAARLPGYLEALWRELARLFEVLRVKLSPEDVERLRASLGGYAGDVVPWIARLLGGLWSGGLALVNLLSLVFITPVVTFYLLRDWDRVLAQVDSWLPLEHKDEIRALAREVDRTLAGFARGQASLCLAMAAYYALLLTLAGLDFGLIVGLASGLVSFIPFVGFLAGFAAAVGIAVAQFSAWESIAIVAGIYLVGQFLEGNVLGPRLVGGRVGLHPVWMIFALFAGGALFGFVGVLIAVPVAAALGVLSRFGLRRYLASPLYTSTPARDDDGRPATKA